MKEPLQKAVSRKIERRRKETNCDEFVTARIPPDGQDGYRPSTWATTTRTRPPPASGASYQAERTPFAPVTCSRVA